MNTFPFKTLNEKSYAKQINFYREGLKAKLEQMITQKLQNVALPQTKIFCKIERLFLDRKMMFTISEASNMSSCMLFDTIALSSSTCIDISIFFNFFERKVRKNTPACAVINELKIFAQTNVF